MHKINKINPQNKYLLGPNWFKYIFYLTLFFLKINQIIWIWKCICVWVFYFLSKWLEMIMIINEFELIKNSILHIKICILPTSYFFANHKKLHFLQQQKIAIFLNVSLKMLMLRIILAELNKFNSKLALFKWKSILSWKINDFELILFSIKFFVCNYLN